MNCGDRGVFALLFFIAAGGSRVVDALTCNCTQDSPRTKCRDSICEASNDSSCLMLEHPTSGRHYTCSTAHLPDGSCMEKITKTGARVIVCSCDSADYCNHKFWPPFTAEDNSEDDYMEYSKNDRVAARAIAAESLRESNAAQAMLRYSATTIAAIIAHTSILLYTLRYLTHS